MQSLEVGLIITSGPIDEEEEEWLAETTAGVDEEEAVSPMALAESTSSEAEAGAVVEDEVDGGEDGLSSSSCSGEEELPQIRGRVSSSSLGEASPLPLPTPPPLV